MGNLSVLIITAIGIQYVNGSDEGECDPSILDHGTLVDEAVGGTGVEEGRGSDGLIVLEDSDRKPHR